jgi:hypothetical protein
VSEYVAPRVRPTRADLEAQLEALRTANELLFNRLTCAEAQLELTEREFAEHLELDRVVARATRLHS